VKAAYSSGKPAFGVGPGNVPVLVDTSADLDDAIPKSSPASRSTTARSAPASRPSWPKASLRDRILSLLKAQKAYIATEAQKEALGKLLIMPNWTVNPQCVGRRPPRSRAWRASKCPPDTSIICAEVGGVGKQHPLSAEKLSPVLSLYFLPDFNSRVETCYALLKFGGLGHTAVIYSRDDARTREYAMRMPAMRRAGEYARAAGFHRHHHQRVSLHDAGLRRGGQQFHLR
jgi:acetaldehyde dehydrogenase (acetylating)